MSYSSKQFVIDKLIELVDSSPTKKIYSRDVYNRYDISQQELDIWVDYVNSVLDILSVYIDPTELRLTKMSIYNLSTQNHEICTMRALKIEKELLNLARRILKHYS